MRLAALEVMSRFAADPKWLIYLPPTMSPTGTPARAGTARTSGGGVRLFPARGRAAVICEEKHMGSRAVVIVCRDEDAARRRFGVVGEGIGICYTRTGPPILRRREHGTGVSGRVHARRRRGRILGEFATDWVCLDAS